MLILQMSSGGDWFIRWKLKGYIDRQSNVYSHFETNQFTKTNIYEYILVELKTFVEYIFMYIIIVIVVSP